MIDRLRATAVAAGLSIAAGLGASSCLDAPPAPAEAAASPGATSPPRPLEAPPAEVARSTPENTADRPLHGRSGWQDLYSLSAQDGTPLIFDRAIVDAPPSDLDRLRAALTGALDARSALDEGARITLQNDVWGLIARLDQASRSTREASLLRESATALVLALAPEAETIDPELMPPALAAILPLEEGWREVASELPAMNHELSFGDRRLFRLFRRRLDDDVEELALADHLLVIDRDGIVRRSAVIGDVELLRFAGAELRAAEVYELRRSGELRHTLQPVAEIAHIPGSGSDTLLAEFEPPEALSDLPCLRCHHDDVQMSLPNPALDPRWREAGVLRRAQTSASRVGTGLANQPMNR